MGTGCWVQGMSGLQPWTVAGSTFSGNMPDKGLPRIGTERIGSVSVHASTDPGWYQTGTSTTCSSGTFWEDGLVNSEGRWSATLAAIAVMAAVAASLSGYLWTVTRSPEATVAGCAEGGAVDCDHVLRSAWSQVAGIPVAAPAAILYAALGCVALCGLLARGVPSGLDLTLTAMAVMAASAGLWFVGLQLLVVDSLCSYCLAIHACGIGCAGLCAWRLSRRFDPHSFRNTGLRLMAGGGAPQLAEEEYDTVGLGAISASVTIGFLPAAILVAVQIFSPQPTYLVESASDLRFANDETTSTTGTSVGNNLENKNNPNADPPPVSDDPHQHPKTSDRRDENHSGGLQVDELLESRAGSAEPAERTIKLVEGYIEMELGESMLLGSPSAEHVIIKMFDYTCHNCRDMHAYLEQAIERYGDRLAVILVPTPLNKGCNPVIDQTEPQHAFACLYARLAWAVWQHNREALPEFHQWLFRPVRPPQPGEARHYAQTLLKDVRLDDAISDPAVDKKLTEAVELYRNCNAGAIPKLIVGDQVLSGRVNSKEHLFRELEAFLDLKPVGE